MSTLDDTTRKSVLEALAGLQLNQGGTLERFYYAEHFRQFVQGSIIRGNFGSGKTTFLDALMNYNLSIQLFSPFVQEPYHPNVISVNPSECTSDDYNHFWLWRICKAIGYPVSYNQTHINDMIMWIRSVTYYGDYIVFDVHGDITKPFLEGFIDVIKEFSSYLLAVHLVIQEVQYQQVRSEKLDEASCSLSWSRADIINALIMYTSAEAPIKTWYKGSGLLDNRNDALAFGRGLVGPSLGQGVTKARSHHWLLNRLADAQLKVSPRCALTLLKESAAAALAVGPRGQGGALFAPEELEAGLKRVSTLERLAVAAAGYPEAHWLDKVQGFPFPTTPQALEERLTESQQARLLALGLLMKDERGRIRIPERYRHDLV